MIKMEGEKKDETTQIPVKKSTRERLRKVGYKGQTYDEIINELIDEGKNAGDDTG